MWTHIIIRYIYIYIFAYWGYYDIIWNISPTIRAKGSSYMGQIIGFLGNLPPRLWTSKQNGYLFIPMKILQYVICVSNATFDHGPWRMFYDLTLNVLPSFAHKCIHMYSLTLKHVQHPKMIKKHLLCMCTFESRPKWCHLVADWNHNALETSKWSSQLRWDKTKPTSTYQNHGACSKITAKLPVVYSIHGYWFKQNHPAKPTKSSRIWPIPQKTILATCLVNMRWTLLKVNWHTIKWSPNKILAGGFKF